jgi:MFS family permease
VVRTQNRYLVLGSSFVLSVGVQAYIIAPASIVPLFASDFGIGRTSVSLAISGALLGMLLVQIPSGLLMDRYDNRVLMGAATLAFAAVGVGSGGVTTYQAFLATRFVGGAAAGVVFTMGANIVAGAFPNKRGFASSIFVSSAPFGFAIGQSTTPVLASRYGWATAFLVFSAIGVAGFLLFVLGTAEPIRSERGLTLSEFSTALRNRSVLVLALSAFCVYSLYMFLNSWMPTYANETFAASLTEAGAAAALLPAIGILARPSGGWVSDRLGRRRAVIASSFVLSVPLFLVIPRSPSIVVFMGFLLVLGFVLQFSTGVYFAFVRELSDPRAAGTSLTVFSTIYMLGTLISPILGGVLVEEFSWSVAFLTYIGFGVTGLVLTVVVSEG